MVIIILFNALLFFIGYSLGAEVRIKDVSGFFNFVERVNSGYSYLKTTVFLDSDLTLSGTVNPIGTNSSCYFRGVFNGQGYVINDLNITKSSQYIGLFGYSKGLTIRNVVLDSSCSMTNSYSGSNSIYVGGIIGYCCLDNGKCNIKNNVNMASISFSGSISSYYLYLGGIAGYLQYSSYVKNCANYGSVTHSGTSKYSYIGGVVGYLYNSYYKYIYNCFNYGTITYSGTTSNYLYLGGIAGRAYYTYIENCVSAGMISSPNKSVYIGSLVGYVSSNTYIKYCYYTDDLSGFKLYGSGTPASTSNTLSYNSNTFKLSKNISIGDYTGNSLVDALNAASDYYGLREYSYWLLNKDENTVDFTINNRDNSIKMNYKIILLPSLASEGNVSFDGWYTNSKCTTPLTSYEIIITTSLYGKFGINTNNYTISFVSRRDGITVDSISAQFNSIVSLPSNLIKDQCSVGYWETIYGDNVGLSLTMPAYNITLYAVWKCTHIKTSDDFLSFSKVVNSGISYSGTTAFLDSDLSLFGYTINPIGTSSNYQFRGVFDGQGYVISNLNISGYSFYYVGLFGYSGGLTIRNVVLDSSCSITNTYSGSSTFYVGGIIGCCKAYN